MFWHLRIVAAVLAAGCGTQSSSTPDALVDAPPNDGRWHVDDGAPMRRPCTNNFGNALTASPTFGRLDGILVALVPPNTSGCHSDSTHLHLQILMNTKVYDVAIAISDDATGVDDVHTYSVEQGSPNEMPWNEGWHTGLLVDYKKLGVKSTDMVLKTKSELLSLLTNDLATVNHISIYGTTYGSDGAHLIHRQTGGGRDGLIVTEPLSSPVKVRLFSFAGQTF